MQDHDTQARPSPLDEALAGEDVEWLDAGGVRLVGTFGEPPTEYAALRRGCGLWADPRLHLTRVTGPDRHPFLNNLVSNALVHPQTKRPLAPGHGCGAFALDLRGRIAAVLRVEEEPDGTCTWVESSVPASDLAAAWDRYRFGEKVSPEPLPSAGHVTLSLVGPEAAAVFAAACDVAAGFPDRPPDFAAEGFVSCVRATLGGADVLAVTDAWPGLPKIDLVVASADAGRVWTDLVTRFGSTGDGRPHGRRRLTPVGWHMFNAARVEAGMPAVGIDFDAAPLPRPGRQTDDTPQATRGTLPAEVGPLFRRCVSTTGGCYLGQEVVARMHARGQSARQLVGIRMDDDALPSAGAPVEVGGVQVGVVTSSTLSPVLSNAPLALATVKRPHFASGTPVVVPAEGGYAKGRVVDLPFVP